MGPETRVELQLSRRRVACVSYLTMSTITVPVPTALRPEDNVLPINAPFLYAQRDRNMLEPPGEIWKSSTRTTTVACAAV
jgi:hypothetical protein